MAGLEVAAATGRDVDRVTTLELFFDLVFVFTITQLTAVLYHAPTWRSLAQVVLMLGVIWWMYGGYAWMTNAVSAETSARRLLLLGGWPVTSCCHRGFAIAPANFVERHGLVVMVAIGESVIAVGIAASHLHVDGSPAAVAALGLALSACLWWLYHGGDDEGAERALGRPLSSRAGDRPRRRSCRRGGARVCEAATRATVAPAAHIAALVLLLIGTIAVEDTNLDRGGRR